jgi:hypothetical protein
MSGRRARGVPARTGGSRAFARGSCGTARAVLFAPCTIDTVRTTSRRAGGGAAPRPSSGRNARTAATEGRPPRRGRLRHDPARPAPSGQAPRRRPGPCRPRWTRRAAWRSGPRRPARPRRARRCARIERCPAQVEETVVDAHGRNGEHLFPDPGELLLHRRARRHEWLGVGRAAAARSRQRLAGHLGRGRERHRVEHHDGRRHHVRGHARGQLGHQDLPGPQHAERRHDETGIALEEDSDGLGGRARATDDRRRDAVGRAVQLRIGHGPAGRSDRRALGLPPCPACEQLGDGPFQVLGGDLREDAGAMEEPRGDGALGIGGAHGRAGRRSLEAGPRLRRLGYDARKPLPWSARRDRSGAGVQNASPVSRWNWAIRSRTALSPIWSAQNMGPPRYTGQP